MARTTGRRLAPTRVARAVAAVAAVLLPATGLATTASSSAVTPEQRGVSLRVVSYNIHTGIGSDGRLDLARTIETLRSLDADVIGLEEVDVHWAARSDWRDQASDIADGLGIKVFFAPIYDLGPTGAGGPRREYGLAVLTDLPVLSTEDHLLTRLSTQSSGPVPEPAPGFPEVVVNARGALVHVYATHLDYRADPSVRALQVQDTLDVLDEDGRRAQQVVVGDFNAPPDAPELAPLWTELVDSWAVAGTGAGLTYPALDPVKRIDYVTHSRNVETLDAEVVDTAASDHRPVVADLVVHRGP